VTILAFSPFADPVEQAQTLLDAGRAEDAVSLLEPVVAAGRGGLFARITLVRARLAADDTAGALAMARELASLHPDDAQVVLALGETLAKTHALPAAIAEFHRALRLDPGFDAARLALAAAWLEAGEPERAEAAFEPVEATPLRESLRARAAHMRGQSRSDAGYVRHLFDQFSANYDESMRGPLRYAAPEILRELLSMVMPGRSGLAVLDVGCGTGLAGEVFKDVAARLDGIDLSPQMIAKARARGIYASLAVGDMESIAAVDTYDLVLAADSLVYLGDLARMFDVVRRSLKPDGQFLFTVEENPKPGFRLGPKRRWRHSESYLREIAARKGFDIAGLMTCAPRSEAGTPVDGFACAFEKRDLAGKVG
jgi:predicted TPR repeat methyltransferase